jgi:hypothetical protein
VDAALGALRLRERCGLVGTPRVPLELSPTAVPLGRGSVASTLTVLRATLSTCLREGDVSRRSAHPWPCVGVSSSPPGSPPRRGFGSLTPRRAERMPRSMALTRSTVFTSFASVHGIL